MTDTLAEQRESLPISTDNFRWLLAQQLHNVYLERFGRQDPIASALESSVEQPVVAVKVGLEQGSVRVLDERETRQCIDFLASEETRSQLLKSSTRRDDNHDWPESVRALLKKIEHGKVRRIKNPNFVSAFDRFASLQFQGTTLPSIEQTAAEIIIEVLGDIETVIDTAKRTDVIARSGRGIRFYKNQSDEVAQLVFAGFIDLLAYNR